MACQRFFVLKINTVFFSLPENHHKRFQFEDRLGSKPKFTSYIPNKVGGGGA